MITEGYGEGLTVRWPTEISGDWATLAATASSFSSEASASAAQMESASVSWNGLASSYREPETQDIVHTALADVPQVTRQWADVAGRLSEVLQAFSTEANGLEQRSVLLREQAASLQARLLISDLFTGSGGGETSFEDEALRRSIDAHNSDVMTLDARWSQLEQQAAADIEALASGGGFHDLVPKLDVAGASLLNSPLGTHADGLNLEHLTSAAIRMTANKKSRTSNVEEADALYEQAMSEGADGTDVQDFLNHFPDMSSDEIEEFAEKNEQANLWNLPAPESEEDLETWPDGEWGVAWWNQSLNKDQRTAMEKHLPLITGNIQGVPSDTRHGANFAALDLLLDSGEHKEYAKNLRSIEEATIPLDRLTNKETTTGQRFLLSLDVGRPHEERQPLAEIAIGNPDVAGDVTYNVPGMESGTHNMVGETNRAQSLYNEMPDRAVVAWMGYDPPTIEETIPDALRDDFLNDDGSLSSEFWSSIHSWEDLQRLRDVVPQLFGQEGSVMSDHRADTGSYRFAYTLDSRQQSSEASDHEVDINVVAHSYGTNLTSHSLTRTDIPVNSVTFMGSSGIPQNVAASASDLNVMETEEGKPAVFVTEAEGDTTAQFGRGWEFDIPLLDPIAIPPDHLFDSPRADPRAEDFNAYVFTSEVDTPEMWEFWKEDPEEESVTDHTRYDSSGEDYGYQDPATLSFDTLVRILKDEWRSVEFERLPQ